MAVDRGEVRPTVEGFALGREEHRHRPAAVTGQDLDRLHVHVVDVGSLLAVYLHAHEVLVHECGGVRVLEGLPLHDVAPVAGGVPDGEEDWTVLGAGPRKGLFAPRVPVDGIVRVLQQIRAGFADQTIRCRHEAHRVSHDMCAQRGRTDLRPIFAMENAALTRSATPGQKFRSESDDIAHSA
jgi:hypothetical protein